MGKLRDFRRGSHLLPLLHLVQLSDLIQKRACLCRVGDPSRGTGKASLEIVGAGGKELIANVKRLAALDAAEEALASEDTP